MVKGYTMSKNKNALLNKGSAAAKKVSGKKNGGKSYNSEENTENNNILNEPATPGIFSYHGSYSVNTVVNQMTSLEKMGIVREGVSKKDLERLKEKSELDYDKLAKALSVTRATLINKKRDQKFGAVLSEKIVGLADIYSYGYEVFEDEDRFNRWMFRPNQALGGKAPYDFIDNQFGREEVKNLIGRIDYGVYS